MNADTNKNNISLEDALTMLFSKILGIDNLPNAFVDTPADKNAGDSITEDTYIILYFNGNYTDCMCTESLEEVIDLIDLAKENDIPIYDIFFYAAKSDAKPLTRAKTEILDMLRADFVSKMQTDANNGGNGS